MKFLADENVASSVIQSLRKAGFDIKDVKESNLLGSSDREIMKKAYEENRIINITYDKDFGNILMLDKQKHKGVILLRIQKPYPETVSKLLLRVLDSSLKTKFSDNLTIISESKITIHTKH